jgi:hypothetical protein
MPHFGVDFSSEVLMYTVDDLQARRREFLKSDTWTAIKTRRRNENAKILAGTFVVYAAAYLLGIYQLVYKLNLIAVAGFFIYNLLRKHED